MSDEMHGAEIDTPRRSQGGAAMNNLTRTEAVLHATEPGSYAAFDEETGAEILALALPHATVADMGSPETLTVTVEVGDQLNGVRRG